MRSIQTVQDRISIVVVQILAKIILSQNDDGSWGPRNSADSTAYAVLALIFITNVPYLQALKVDALYAFGKGRQALLLMRDLWKKPLYPWLSRGDAEPSVVLEAYLVAAMGQTPFEHLSSEKTMMIAEKQTQEVLKFSKYFSGLPYMKGESFSMIKATILEGIFYIPLLKSRRNEIFPATNAKERDKYFDYIPPLWLFASTLGRIFLPPDMMLDMMIRSMFIFLVDEYMESNVTDFSPDELQKLKNFIETIHPENDSSRSNPRLPGFLQGEDTETDNGTSATNGPSPNGTAPHAPHPESSRLQSAISIFRTFATRVLDWPHARNASPNDLLELRSSTKNYLLYHIVQIEDNALFAAQPSHKPGKTVKFATPRTPYHVWAHTVGAGHVSGPFSFAFALCCIGGGVRGGKDCFAGVRQKLHAYKMNAHIGAYCRLYNDFGSVKRDREERNLNSINFPEFFTNDNDNDNDGDGDADAEADARQEAQAKAMLREAAEFERKCAVESAEPLLRELEAEGKEGTLVANCLRV